MKRVKTEFRSRMDDEFMGDSMTLCIEQELTDKIDLDSLIDYFYFLKHRRAQLQ